MAIGPSDINSLISMLEEKLPPGMPNVSECPAEATFATWYGFAGGVAGKIVQIQNGICPCIKDECNPAFDVALVCTSESWVRSNVVNKLRTCIEKLPNKSIYRPRTGSVGTGTVTAAGSTYSFPLYYSTSNGCPTIGGNQTNSWGRGNYNRWSLSCSMDSVTCKVWATVGYSYRSECTSGSTGNDHSRTVAWSLTPDWLPTGGTISGKDTSCYHQGCEGWPSGPCEPGSMDLSGSFG
jgi:hypothetical protein